MPALLELRRYRLHPGARDALTRVFVDELIHTQEAVGLQVIGPYADEDEPDHFVWLRGFATDDPEARGRALAAFYGGPDWAAHKDAANATMIAFDDVHLLRPTAGAGVPDGPLSVTIGPDIAAAEGAYVLETADVPNTFPALPVRTDRVRVVIEPAAAAELVTATTAQLTPLR